MSYPQNAYPNSNTYQEVSFPEEVTPPSVEPDVDMMCVRYNPAWSRVLASACSQLTQLSAWSGTDDEKKLAVNRATNLKILLQQFEECDMSGCCERTTPILSRVDPDHPWIPQISYDDGSTWITDPSSPALTAPTLPAPVTSGVSSTKCDAASNGLEHITDLVNKQADDLSGDAAIIDIALLIASAVVGAILAPEVAIPVIAPVLIGAVSLVFVLGHDDFVAYFSSTNYDIIRCAIYCHIGDDGRLSDAGFSAVVSDLGVNLPASAARDWLIQIIEAMGVKGLNNLCAYGSAAGSDCSACDCGCNLTGWGVITNGSIVGTPTDSLVTIDGVLNAGAYRIDFTSHVSDFDASTHFSSGCCQLYFRTLSGGAGATVKKVDCGGSYADNLDNPAGSPTAAEVWLMEYNSPVPIQVQISTNADFT